MSRYLEQRPASLRKQNASFRHSLASQILCAPPQISVVAERTIEVNSRHLQLIPESLRQIPKTSRKVTNLRADSLTVPRI